LKLTVHIKENSSIAACAAFIMKSQTMAITIGNTIYLHGTTIDSFFNNKEWLTHEVAHVHQFATCNKWIFIIQYCIEWLKRGYFNNKYEVAARANEKNFQLLQNVQFVMHPTTV
jgi:hypothetical protein